MRLRTYTIRIAFACSALIEVGCAATPSSSQPASPAQVPPDDPPPPAVATGSKSAPEQVPPDDPPSPLD